MAVLLVIGIVLVGIMAIGTCQRIYAWWLYPHSACYRANSRDCLGSHQFSRAQDIEALRVREASSATGTEAFAT